MWALIFENIPLLLHRVFNLEYDLRLKNEYLFEHLPYENHENLFYLQGF